VAAHDTGPAVPPPPVPGLPRQVSRVCLACLSRNPADRPTAEDVAHTLATAVGPPTATAAIPVTTAEPAATTRPAGYAVGSARLPHPPTMIDPWVPTPPVDADPTTRRVPRPLLIALVSAVAVLGLALAVLAAMVSHPPGRNAQALPPSPATTAAPPASTAAASSVPIPSATTAPAIADALDAVIADALASGRIAADTAARLRDKVDSLRRSHGQKRVREHARELQKTINELVADGKLDQQTAAQLTDLLQPLTPSD
jgi:hypothetical protein